MEYKIRDNLVLYKIVPVSIFFQSAMIFYTLLPSIVVGALSFLIFVYYIWSLKSFFNLADSLFLISILFIPTSTISILGTSYSSLPLTWHNLLIIILIIYIAIEGTLDKNYFLIIFLFVLVGILPFAKLPYLTNALKQLLVITLFMCSFIIGKRFSLRSHNLSEIGWKFYFLGVLSFAVQIFLQKAYISLTGVIIGHYAEMGLNRIAYAGLMGDYSFASLYLATGCLYVFLQYVHFHKWKIIGFIVMEMILMIAILSVTSRTGLIALLVTLILYYIFNIRRITIPKILVLILGSVSIPIIIVTLMAGRVGQTLLDSSGRTENYIMSFNAFKNNMFIGYGLGLDNLYALTGIKAPHNFFIQYLTQTGIIGTIIILSSFIKFSFEQLKSSGCYKWFFLMIVIGAMFIPDIVSSRFLYAIVVLCMISTTENFDLK